MKKRKIFVKNNLQRWLISYADFITLLFAFFVVMYAISSVNEGKYRDLSKVFELAFNKTNVDNKTNSKTIEKKNLDLKKHNEQDIKKYEKKSENSQKTQNKITINLLDKKFKTNFKGFIDRGLLIVEKNQNWLELELEPDFLFTEGSAKLSVYAEDLIKRLAKNLKKISNFITVEGFSDDKPITNEIFLSNWELSASRAASVVKLLIEEGVAKERLSIVGYGVNYPTFNNKTKMGRHKNRKVILLIEDSNKRKEYLKNSTFEFNNEE